MTMTLAILVVVPYYMLYIVGPLFGDLTSRRPRADEASDRSFCFQSLLEKSKSESTLSDLFNKVVTTAFASVIICATYLREFATYLREIFATYRVLGVSRIVGNYYKLVYRIQVCKVSATLKQKVYAPTCLQINKIPRIRDN